MSSQKNKNSPVEVKNHNNSGKYGLYSNKGFLEGKHSDILTGFLFKREGEEIFMVKPLIAVLDEKHLATTCSNCFISEEDNDNIPLFWLSCKGCKILQYCCQTCQKEDWEMFHQYECAFFLSKLPKIIPGSIRMCMRLIFYGRRYPFSLEWNTIMELESHRSEIMSSERKDMVWMMSKGIQSFTNETNETLVLDLFCKIMINSFSLMTSSYDTIGTAIEPTISRINHSCCPNAALVFDRNTIALRSLNEIAPGQQITISYIDTNNIQKDRKDELLSRYYFSCNCIRCGIPEKLESYVILKNKMTLNAFSHLETLINQALNQKNDHIFEALSILHCLNGWNSVIYPLNKLHNLALIYFLDKKCFHNALCHGLYIHLIGNNFNSQYVSNLDPIYVTQKFLLVRLIIFQASENDQKQFKRIDVKDLMKFAYKLLYELVNLSYKSHGSFSRFSKKLQKTFEETNEDICIYDWGKHWQLMLKNDPENPQIKKECSTIEDNLLLVVKEYIKELCNKKSKQKLIENNSSNDFDH